MEHNGAQWGTTEHEAPDGKALCPSEDESQTEERE